DGTYYMKLNIRDQPRAAADAVYQLQTSLTNARTALNDITDAVASQIRFDPLANGAYRIVITPRDWRSQAITRSLGPVQITASGSIGFSIGAVQAAGDGSYQATLTPNTATPPARNAFLISIQDGTRTIWLPPNRTVLTLGTSGNQPPIANFSSAANGLTVVFTDTSTDSDGTIASRTWAFGDGTTSTSTNPSKTYATAGTYNVSLTVTDNGGLTNTRTKTQSVVGTSQVQTYTNTTDFNITDNMTVNSPITVSGRSGNAPAATSVAVNIVHTYIGDLRVSLIAPDGSAYVLHNRSGGGTDNIATTYSPNLSSEPLNGTWKLRVSDQAGGDVGYIDSWSITF
ncbi:MAG: proprotein convertase P-domain-containing protein, partial [Rhodanobacteraceae bacterium]|nr:proprotein convertase P-domain-containing protein [Rhodanobacteraceae bacterium]